MPGDLDYYDSQAGALAAPPAPRDDDGPPAPIDDDAGAPAPMSDDDDAPFVSVTQSQSQDEAPPAPAAPRTTTKKQRARKKPAAKKKRKPCLLYTSPSPRDQRGSRMPSSA